MTRPHLKRVTPYLWEISPHGAMLVPARVYASAAMIEQIMEDQAPAQAANVAHLPGIITASLAMPDIHWGYGFPIGGVAAFDVTTGVISPGGVGYDINCGVRLLASQLHRNQVSARMEPLVDALFSSVPTGVGIPGRLRLSEAELHDVARQGARWAVAQGLGEERDLPFIEENGCMAGAEPRFVSEKAWARGRDQLGTLGSGNHFLELGYIAKIYDTHVAERFGLFPDQVTVLIHTGSRGFGYQVCEDYLLEMDSALERFGIRLPDRQLACAPITSPEGERYLGAMRCAVNYAFANRQIIAHHTRRVFQEVLALSDREIDLKTVYEVAHNIAKVETHLVAGVPTEVCVHRKGATRAFGPGHPDVPEAYRDVGQPVLIPGDMGRYSYVLVGTSVAMQETFGSTCHGAGRRMSRRQAKRTVGGRDIAGELRRRGIYVRGATTRTLNEEISEAYKDVADVVDVCEAAGISRRVAQIKPLGCIKG